jgi:hypothetical protein
MERIFCNVVSNKTGSQSMINFCFDILGEYGIGYPNLAKPGLLPDEFDVTWPYTIPNRLQMYLDSAGIRFSIWTVDSAPLNSWYPISLAWHDFDCDYFALLSDTVKTRLRQHQIKILFYYHEGDNPQRIQQRFDYCCVNNQLPLTCYRFISANSAANSVDKFYYFCDHESFLKYINRTQPLTAITDAPRDRAFTALTRSHKWWRAAAVSQLLHEGMLEQSFWSYNTECLVGDQPEDNPIPLSNHEQDLMNRFVAQGPYYCDSDNADAHNDHRFVVEHLYTHSYCHLVLETLFDADQSGGAFVTEKTYKCIKFGQPFVIIGTVGSLECLRAAGYRTFDNAIDNSYDLIKDNSLRWGAIKRTIADIRQQNLYEWYLKCLPDLIHNQQVYNNTVPSLSKIVEFLTADCDTV